MGLAPSVALAQDGAGSLSPDYSWYSADAASYTITSSAAFAGFANLVNGTADVDGDGNAEAAVTFEGKTVQLGNSISFQSATLQPVGTAENPFQGIFDGQNCTLDNFVVRGSAASASNLGLFGYAGSKSTIQNLTVGEFADVTIELGSEEDRTQDNTVAIENVGLVVGYSEGQLSNITSEGDVTAVHHMSQTKKVVFPVRNVGGIAGACLGDITNCTTTSAASVTVRETGYPYKAATATEDWDDQSVLAICVGGIVGQAGQIDSSTQEILDTAAKRDADGNLPEGDDDSSSDDSTEAEPAVHGTISNCQNNANVVADTPQENGTDRFGNQIYAQGCDVGGIAGYSRGSVLNCSNTGYMKGKHAKSMAGIVGNLRCKTETTSYNGNFTSEGSDDGVAAGESDALEIKDCTNLGCVYGYAFPAGIVGRAGTYTSVLGCINGSPDVTVQIIGTRPTKPFVSGIAGSTAGTVSYCANFADLFSGKWKDESADNNGRGEVVEGGGYYVSGLVGNTVYFTKKNADGDQERYTPLPEVYACLSAGQVNAIDNMRQRLLVGDNAGFVHNCVGVTGLCYKDMLVYGMYAGDNESSGGSWSNLYAVAESDLKDNAEILVDEEGEDGKTVQKSTGYTSLGVLNALSAANDFSYYWVIDPSGSANDGWPVLNRDASWDRTDISAAQVELKANASYTGGAAVPQATVTLDGKQLVQDVDFQVQVSESATAMTVEGATDVSATPYTATIMGVGNYTGTAIQPLSYDICRGSLETCTVTVDAKTFNWNAQVPAKENVHVKDATGTEIDSFEYEFELDAEDKDLNDDGQAVNVGHYTVNLQASTAEGTHFTGSATGDFTIKTAKIGVDKDADKQAQLAKPEGVTYLGETYDWDSQTLAVDVKDYEPKMKVAYTGRSIKPEVTAITYKGKELTYGTDYKTLYGGDGTMDGSTDDTPNVGVKGGTAKGYITARYVAGGNFSNYDIMFFTIDDTSADEGGMHEDKHSIAKAVFKGTEDVIYEAGDPYTPVTVWYGGSQLVENKDYTISYQNNGAVGTATFTVVGKGDFEGTAQGSFNIVEGSPYELLYSLDDETNEATVTGVEYNGLRDTFDLVIPSQVEKDGVSYTVTAIGAKSLGGASPSDFTGSVANESKTKIRKVTIPTTVRTIGDYAFSSGSNTDWNKLSVVKFEDALNSQLETIGEGAFCGCGNLTSFVFPAGVDTIGKKAFQTGSTSAASKLTTLTFLTKDASMPSNIATSLTFGGVGVKSTKVTVKAFAEATRVKQLVSQNAGTSSGTNAGRNFVFQEMTTYTGKDEVDMSGVKFAAKTVTYNGKAQSITATGVPAGVQVAYTGNGKVNAGTYTVTATFKVDEELYDTPAPMTAKLTIKQAAQSISVASAQLTKTVKAKKVKKAKQTTTKVVVKGAQGKVTYKKASGSAKLSIGKSTGKITVKKGTKKGTYKLKVKITAAGSTNYAAATVTKTIKVKVK